MDNSPNLFTIADLSEVWVVCDVYENDLHRVRMGDPAEVRLNAFPDRVFTGRVGNISTVLDPSTRTAKVRLELANPGGLMRRRNVRHRHFPLADGATAPDGSHHGHYASAR